MKKLVTAMVMVMVLLFAVSAIAAPVYVVCTPYLIDGSEPSSFIVILNGTTYTGITPTAYDATHVYLHYDISSKVNLTGNVLTVKASNIWNDSGVSAAKNFSASPPATPTGIGFFAN